MGTKAGQRMGTKDEQCGVLWGGTLALWRVEEGGRVWLALNEADKSQAAHFCRTARLCCTASRIRAKGGGLACPTW
eukprot:313103-Chlamydomonas_euryale.AAC.1